MIIPGSFNGHIVTAIGAKAFRDKPTLVTVTVPLTVKTLEEYNFEACENLTEVRGIDNVEIIGMDCFNYSKKTILHSETYKSCNDRGICI